MSYIHPYPVPDFPGQGNEAIQIVELSVKDTSMLLCLKPNGGIVLEPVQNWRNLSQPKGKRSST